MINTMKNEKWVEAWRMVRSGACFWASRWTPEPVLMANEALMKRRTWEGTPSPLAHRLASFKAKKYNEERQ